MERKTNTLPPVIPSQIRDFEKDFGNRTGERFTSTQLDSENLDLILQYFDDPTRVGNSGINEKIYQIENSKKESDFFKGDDPAIIQARNAAIKKQKTRKRKKFVWLWQRKAFFYLGKKKISLKALFASTKQIITMRFKKPSPKTYELTEREYAFPGIKMEEKKKLSFMAKVRNVAVQITKPKEDKWAAHFRKMKV